MADTPKALGYRMPAEWEPHEGTWLSWPHSPRSWAGNFGPISDVFVEIVRALCPCENVHIAVRDAVSEAGVRRLLRERGLDSAAICFHQIPTNDAWARDHGPTFITRAAGPQLPLAFGEGEALLSSEPLPDGRGSDNPEAQEADAAKRSPSSLAVVDWRFNSWGGKYPPWEDDDAVPDRVAELLKLPCFHPRLVLEGGSIDVNGHGTLLTTESVLLNPNRNPQLSRKQIEARLDEYLAARHVIWLGSGIIGDDTDGHVDDLVRFVNSSTVVAMVEDDPADENYRALQENFERLQGARDQDGHPLEIVKLPTPGKIFRGAQQGERPAEERLPASYANFYIANGAVLVPIFGHANDREALGFLGEFFTGRKIVGIRCNDLVGGYGAIHCVTQQQPR